MLCNRYLIGGSTLFYPQLASLNTYQFFIEVKELFVSVSLCFYDTTLVCFKYPVSVD